MCCQDLTSKPLVVLLYVVARGSDLCPVYKCLRPGSKPALLGGQLRDQGDLQTAKKQWIKNARLQFDL